MQCVIICAGKGTRMRPLTENTPKPLIHVCGKSVLHHIVEALPTEIDEIILVVGYLQEQIRNLCKDVYLGKKVVYCEQKNFSGGTGDALLCAESIIHGKFLFMFADDIHGKEAIKKIVNYKHAILSAHSETPERFGVLVVREDDTLEKIVEKPKVPPSNLINTGVFVATPSIFSYKVLPSDSGELYATDILTAYAQDNPLQVIEQNQWLPIGYPEHILEAEKILCPKK